MNYSEIKIGDTHVETKGDMKKIVKVQTKPIYDEDMGYKWNSQDLNTGDVINYWVVPGSAHNPILENY